MTTEAKGDVVEAAALVLDEAVDQFVKNGHDNSLAYAEAVSGLILAAEQRGREAAFDPELLAENDDLIRHAADIDRQLAAAQERERVLRAALREYGVHKLDCSCHDNSFGFRCTCGLHDLEGKPPTPGWARKGSYCRDSEGCSLIHGHVGPHVTAAEFRAPSTAASGFTMRASCFLHGDHEGDKCPECLNAYGDLREQRGREAERPYDRAHQAVAVELEGPFGEYSSPSVFTPDRDLEVQLAAAQERERVLRECLEQIAALSPPPCGSHWATNSLACSELAHAALDATRDGGAL